MWGRDREGGGDSASRAGTSALKFRKSGVENQDSWSCVCPASDCKQPQCLLYPPPCPSPTWGEETLWHRSSHLSRCIRVRVPTRVHALAFSWGRTDGHCAKRNLLLTSSVCLHGHARHCHLHPQSRSRHFDVRCRGAA